MCVAAFDVTVTAITTGPIECGVGSTQFAQNPPVLSTAVQTKKLRFWWNWGAAPNVDVAGIAPATVTAMKKAFVPMLWGEAPPDNYDFLADAEGDVMGYNEPDLYGPACCDCDGKQSYAPATSSGWLPLFDPASASKFWQSTVNNLTSSQRTGTTARRIVSPAMANSPAPAPGVDCTLDPAAAANPKRCQGWLQLFKGHTLKLACTKFDGTKTNCWYTTHVHVCPCLYVCRQLTILLPRAGM